MNKTTHTISVELVKAYSNANYIVHAEHVDIFFKIGHSSPELALLMHKRNVRNAAFLTAFNCHSVPDSPQVNKQNQESLIADIESLGLDFILGKGGDQSYLWSSEDSVFVLGITPDDADLLADRYGQNAYVWIAGDEGLVQLNLRYPIESHLDEC